MKTTLANLLVLAISIGVSLMLLEGLTRVFFSPVKQEIDAFGLTRSNSHNIFNHRKFGYYQEDGEIGWILRKNISGRQTKERSFDVTFRTNSRGLRDKDYELEKPDNVTRIVVLGDSFTWGFGVNDDEVYTEVLERRLNDVEVINLGVTGFAISQEIRYLKREGLKYNPDIVLLALCMNDLPYAQFEPRTLNRKRLELPSDESLFVWVKKRASENSALYSFVKERINTSKTLVKLLVRLKLKERLEGFGELDINLKPALKVYPETLQEAFEFNKRQLRKVHDELRDKGIRFIIAMIPSLQSVDEKAFRHSIAYLDFSPEDFELGKPYRLIEEFGEENGIEVINPLFAFRRKHTDEATLFLRNDMHFTEFGHELFAQEIAEYLDGTE